MYMFAHYLEKGHTLEELCNLTPLEKSFYIASMSVMNEEGFEKDSILAKMSNPIYGPKK